MKVYYKNCVPPTCFGHSRGHLQGFSLKKYVYRNNTEVSSVLFAMHLPEDGLIIG
jgi:hypothetical protein